MEADPHSNETSAAADGVAPQASGPTRQVSQARRLAVLAIGLLAAFYLGSRSPKEQHVRVMLGDAAPRVTQLELRYVHVDGEILRQARFSFEPGHAPRVLAHDPSLPDGDYRVLVDVDLSDGHREVERRITLASGSTQLELGRELGASERHGQDAP